MRSARNLLALASSTALVLSLAGPATAVAAASGPGGAVVSADVDVVVADWSATTAYNAGDQATYAGSVWEAGWWTKGQVPGDPNGPWQELRTSPEGDVIWTPSRAFDSGDVVLHEGVRYVAKWHTRNQLPTDPNGPWRPVSGQGPQQPGAPTDWTATGTYDTGDLVREGGHLWQALWWPGHQRPGALDGPWGEVAFTPDGSVIWTPTRVFNAGDRVVFMGAEHVAKWWTRNQAPGDANGPWRLASTDPAGSVLVWTADAVFAAGDVVAHAAGRFVATQANRDAEPGDPTGPWAVLPDSALVTVPPAIAGIARVGRTVRASAGRWDGAGLTFSYRWFAGARPLARAAGRTLEIPAAVAGRRLRVVVTAHRQGAAVGSAASPAVRVKPRP